jgi:predicted dehydrogenase
MIPEIRCSRRRFLSAATSAVAAPLILPSHVWAAPVKPNDKIALGFIGVGIQNRGLLNGFINRADTHVVAVCDVDTSRRVDTKGRVDGHYFKRDGATDNACAAYNAFEDLLARKDIDAVVIATPDHWHALISIAAAEAKKDIYCEKPLCQSIHEARAMVNAVRKHKRVFQTGSMQRSAREFRVAVELIRNGVIGTVQKVDVAVGGPGVPCDLPEEPMEPGLDWDRWLGPAPMRPYNSILSPRGINSHFPMWRAYREYGGGMVTDWGAHHFDIAQWGLDADNGGPVEVIPPGDWQKAQSGVKLRYANGVEVTHQAGNGSTFYGKGGELYINRGRISVKVGDTVKGKAGDKGDAPLKDVLDRLEAEFLGTGKQQVYRSANHLGDFLDAMRKRSQPICDVEIGARTVSVCHLVNLAYYHGQTLKWDAKSEQFTGGTGNKAWLDVSYRGPWKLG